MALMREVNWGLIGAGDIVRKRVARALADAPRSALVAVARAQADRAEAFAATIGARRWYASTAELVADADIDAVYIATPVHLHAAQTVAAAEAGKHVLCEKPMAMSVAECDRMIDACRAHGVSLGVAYYRHFYPAVARIKAILASGEIGAPVVAQIEAFERFDPRPDDPRAWLLDPARSGGGPMMDFGCHRIEVLLNLFGSVTRASGKTTIAAFDRRVEDTAAAVLEFERGPLATLVVTHAASEPRDTVTIFGTRGSIRVGVLNAGDVTVTTADGRTRAESHPPAPNLHQPLVEDFVEALAAGRPPAVPGEAGRAVAEIEKRIYETALH